MSPGKASHWVLVHTKPDPTSLAKRNLERQGFRCSFPLVRQNRTL